MEKMKDLGEGKESVMVWESHWKKAKVEEWDDMSETILRALLRGAADLKGKLFLEAGSGTGRISFRLKEDEQGDVILLDVSRTAIGMSKHFFENRGQAGYFILGSIFRIPIQSDSIDVVWNAGVLEHFTEYETRLAIGEMARVCRKHGVLITLNPYSKAVLYRIGKWFAEKRKRWIYGFERPVKSITGYPAEGCTWIAEYSTDFDTSIGFLSSIPSLRFFIPLLRRFFKRLPPRILNRFGYLLVSIASKGK
ncbi:MAG: class I SAM-dependent methyltransferase [Candidatus Bathyarchaeota archaeon]|nr:MAG: class I SAM-dependent methyltransferase [Candidatus Bathyarchaeota archaeon]